MKVEVWYLMRSRQAKKKKISDSKQEVTFNRGIYIILRDAINFYRKGDKPKGVEIFYYEGNPAPIKIESKGDDDSINYLNRYIYENVIEQTGALPKERVSHMFNWMRENLSIGNVVKWGFMLLIIGVAIGGQIGLW
ncbi:hypothetical protein ES702_01857 [subsurface metagenome]